MNLTELTIRLLLLFFPGIICFYVVDSLTVHHERKPHQVFLLAYVYGLLCYAIYALIAGAWVIGRSFSIAADGKGAAVAFPEPIGFAKSLTDAQAKVDLFEVALVTVLAIVLGFALSYIISHKWLFSLAKRLKCTQKFGELDVWAFTLNLDEVRWANVRDMKNNIMFSGYVRAFSDVEESAELLLTQVIAYNEKTGEELYHADRLFLARQKDDLTIEFPDSPA